LYWFIEYYKINIYKKYLDLIKNSNIKEFTEFTIVRLPDYFWTLPASTSGTRHGNGESLLDHVLNCLEVSIGVIDQFKKVWGDLENSQLISSLILHDGWRCGVEGFERRFTQEYVEKRGFSTDLVRKLSTNNKNPEDGYKQLLKLLEEFRKDKIIEDNEVDTILNAVRYHYGPFTRTKLECKFDLNLLYSNVIVQVHNIEFHQALNSKVLKK